MYAPIKLAEALRRLPGPNGARFFDMFTRGTLEIEIYAPRGHDPQRPHAKDEVYIVTHGTGVFMNAGRRYAFEPGDVLFVPAGMEHRFEEFSDDFSTWVIFYGGPGGELPLAGAEPADRSDPQSRNELLVRTHAAHDELTRFLDSLDEARATGPADPAGWTVRDHLTHLAVWEAGIVALFDHRPRWAAMGLPDLTPDQRKEFDKVNDLIFKQHRGRSWNDARWLFHSTHQAFLSRIMALRDEDLYAPYSQYQADSPTRADPVIGFAWGDGGAHFREHLPWMKAIVEDA